MENVNSQETGFELLAEKDAMWAEMLMQALKDNDVPCAAVHTYIG